MIKMKIYIQDLEKLLKKGMFLKTIGFVMKCLKDWGILSLNLVSILRNIRLGLLKETVQIL